jgi:hypothetical protein
MQETWRDVRQEWRFAAEKKSGIQWMNDEKNKWEQFQAQIHMAEIQLVCNERLISATRAGILITTNYFKPESNKYISV